MLSIFTSPRRSPGRAIALPPASESAFIFVHIWYDDRYSSKVLFSNTPAHHPKVKVRSKSWTFKFLMLKIFKSSYFSNYMMDFVHIWYDDRYSSKVLFSNTLPMLMTSQSHRLKSFILKFFKSSYFPDHMIDFVHI